MVGGTGFEPDRVVGQCADTPLTLCEHCGVNTGVQPHRIGHPEDTSEQSKDTPASCPSCSFVARDGLQHVVEVWDRLPPDIQKLILTIADAAVVMRGYLR